MAAMDWMREKQLNEEEMNFILTFIPTLSALMQKDAFREKIMRLLESRFPSIHINEEMNFGSYREFDTFLQEGFQGKIHIDEFIDFVEENHCCKDWCAEILASKKYGE